MELVLPSLLLLLAAAFFVFGLFPRLGPSVLVTLAIVSLILVVQHHMELFDLEYRDLTIIDSLKDNAPLMLIILTTAMIIGFFLLVTGFLSRGGSSENIGFSAFVSQNTNNNGSCPPGFEKRERTNSEGKTTTECRKKVGSSNLAANKSLAESVKELRGNSNKSKEGQSGQSLGAFFSKYA